MEDLESEFLSFPFSHQPEEKRRWTRRRRREEISD
jgi:hypothetical protein